METQSEFAGMPKASLLSARMEAELRAAGGTDDDVRVLAQIPAGKARAAIHDGLVHFRARGFVDYIPLLESLVEKAIKNGKPKTVGGITLVCWARGEFGIQISNDLGAFYVGALRIKRPDFRPYLELKERTPELLFRHAWNPFAPTAENGR